MHLNALELSRQDLKDALDAQERSEGLTDMANDPDTADSYWNDYRADDYDTDYMFVQAVTALDAWLQDHPQNTMNAFTRAVREHVDITLVADLDSSVGGYEFDYTLSDRARTAPTLNLGTYYVEWGTARGSQDGIEGVIDFLETALHYINKAIAGYNHWATR